VAATASDADVDTGRSNEGIRRVRDALLGRRLRGRRFCEAYTEAVDDWLAELLTGALAGAGRTGAERIALIAVGGYGRRELCPGSDLDLLLVHDGVRKIGRVADALWYPIWDSGINMDHSVRTPRETIGVVKGDLKDALGLLNARLVAGDEDLATETIDGTRRAWASAPRISLGRLREAISERWTQHGELAFLLEPDVKLARGGLRDLDALEAMAIAAPVVGPFLSDARLEEAEDSLLSIRVALHTTTGKRSDRLMLEDQDAVARRLGLADAEELLPAVAAAGRRVAWAADEAWRRVDAWLAGPRRTGAVRPFDTGVAIRDDELTFEADADVAMDAAFALRIAAASARSGIPIATEALARLESEAVPPEEPWSASTREALIDLLGYGHVAVPLFETLDHIGVLGRYVREWPAVRSKPQRNVYHRYTVDRHLFEAAAEAAERSRSVHRPDLLLVAAFLHDIGKGFPGDHTVAGERLVGDIATRMGFADADVAILVRMVGNHLLLADTAMRRDLSDPATIEMVAERIGSIEELELLAALTEADSIATGPAAWSGWKSTLIEELVLRVRGLLSGEVRPEAPPALSEEQRSLAAEGRLRLLGEGSRVTIVAPDRPGLLATVAGVLAAGGLSVHAATGLSEAGMAVEVFDLAPSVRGDPDWARLEADLASALADPPSLRERLDRRARSSRLPSRPGAARVAAPRVIFDNDATPRATIVEVRAPDGVGVLSGIGRALAACGCDIAVVRALTLGHEVVDTFYVIDGASSEKVTEPERLGAVERAILAELETRS